MDLATVVTFIYEAGNELVERCELVKQCHSEATRIAVRTVRVMGSLEDASREFSGDAALNTSLIELKRVLQEARELVERCQRPRSVVAKARAIARANVNQQGLLDVEAQLLRITGDLHIPMQTDIRRAIRAIQQTLDRAGGDEHSEALQQAVREVIREEFDARIAPGRRSVRAIVEAQVGSSGAAGRHPAGESDAAGQLMFRLGRVRFNRLEEGEDILGEGTFGVVYAGRYMGQEVAVKKARGVVGDPAVLREFRREAEIHFAMRHENIVRVLAFSEGSRERPPCLVMERMEESISSFLRTVRAPPPLRERLETIRDVCQGLVFLHQHRITHRDVKSQNILLDGGGTAKLSDFGLAVVGRTMSSSIASSTPSTSATVDVDQKVGSEQYMAPEVHAGKMATAASDVFSLHVVMWEVLTHQKARVVSPIGLRLLSFSDAKLLVGSSVPTAQHDEAQALLNQCGRKEGKERPGVEGVLDEVNSLLHKLTDTPSDAPPTDGLLSPSAKNNRAPAASAPAPAPPPPPAKEEDDEDDEDDPNDDDDDDPKDTPLFPSLSPPSKNVRAPAASVPAPAPPPPPEEEEEEEEEEDADDDTDRNWRPGSFRKTDGQLVYPATPTTDTAAGATGAVASPKLSHLGGRDGLPVSSTGGIAAASSKLSREWRPTRQTHVVGGRVRRLPSDSALTALPYTAPLVPRLAVAEAAAAAAAGTPSKGTEALGSGAAEAEGTGGGGGGAVTEGPGDANDFPGPDDGALTKKFRVALTFYTKGLMANAKDYRERDKLALYGLFKQSKWGDCPAGLVSTMRDNPVGSVKVRAWVANRGKSTAQAMEEFMAILGRVAPDWESRVMRPGSDDSRGAASPSSSLRPSSVAGAPTGGSHSGSGTEQKKTGRPVSRALQQIRFRLMKRWNSTLEGTPVSPGGGSAGSGSTSISPAGSPPAGASAAEPQKPTSFVARVVDDVGRLSMNHGGLDGRSGGAVADATAAAAAAGGSADSTRWRDQGNLQRINHRLQRFVRMSKLKKVALNVIAQQLTEAEVGHLREVFEVLDSQKKGIIGPDELQKVVQQAGIENSTEDALQLLQGIDIDGTNNLNYREFLAAAMERSIFIREDNIRCAFDYFDLDGNSEITFPHLVKILGAEEHAREAWGRVKHSVEGVINYDEFKTMMMDMPLHWRDPPPRIPMIDR